MTNPHCLQDVTTYRDEPLQELAWAMKASEGNFSILLAHCNDIIQQDCIRERLREICELSIHEIFLDKSDTKLYTPIKVELANKQPSALMIFGLESVIEIEQMLITTNLVRNDFKNFSLPIVLWVNDEVIVKLQRIAPDFYSWTTTTQFAVMLNISLTVQEL
ncbi:hypothetical protein A6770_23135 [Nostoc minutum NIES-26]|uniref:Uncharacterized protein n=1 Tax=Nostoc minutum NIES-26 TaxID=1844469 RepID=A0A367QZA4_9NOSO|nr:hypothetical protein A6770_23135 [Nostoc minutum NIES-26]